MNFNNFSFSDFINNYTNSNILYDNTLINTTEETDTTEETSNVYQSNSNSYNSIDIANAIFNKANFIFLLWFLGIYILSYFLLGSLLNKDVQSFGFQQRLSRGIDIIFLFFLILFLLAFYFLNTDMDKEIIIQSFLNNYNDYLNEPKSIISIFTNLLSKAYTS
jgi:hypothetical protein